MVEDWVLIEAAKQAGFGMVPVIDLLEKYTVPSYQVDRCFRALCDMIAKYEQPPVDPDVRLVADIVNAFEGLDWDKSDTALLYSENIDRAVAVYKASKA